MFGQQNESRNTVARRASQNQTTIKSQISGSTPKMEDRRRSQQIMADSTTLHQQLTLGEVDLAKHTLSNATQNIHNQQLKRDSSVQYSPNANYINEDRNIGSNRNKSTFLPAIGIGRKLIGSDDFESITDKNNNPFRTPQQTERILIMGERDREIIRLEAEKFRLSQLQAKNGNYIDALALRQIGQRENRDGILDAVRTIAGETPIPRKIVSLKPHIKGYSERNGESNLAIQTTQDGSGLLQPKPSGRSFSTQRYSIGSTTQRSISPKNSPLNSAKELENRYMTPQKATGSLTSNPLRYLNSDKFHEKESTKEYILANRRVLVSALVNNDKKEYLEQIKEQCKQKQEGLEMAKEMFAEDLQRFQSMKSEMITIDQLKAEELIRDKEESQKLELEVIRLNAALDLIEQDIFQHKKLIFTHCDSKRFAYWIRLQLDNNQVQKIELHAGNGLFITEQQTITEKKPLTKGEDSDNLELLSTTPEVLNNQKLDEAVDFKNNFEIDYKRQQVIQLMNKYEEINTELAVELNIAEVVLLELKTESENKLKEQKKVLDEVDENLIVLQLRYKFLQRQNKLYMRPLQEKMEELRLRELAKQQGKPYRFLLSEQQMLPKLIEMIKTIYRKLKYQNKAGEQLVVLKKKTTQDLGSTQPLVQDGKQQEKVEQNISQEQVVPVMANPIQITKFDPLDNITTINEDFVNITRLSEVWLHQLKDEYDRMCAQNKGDRQFQAMKQAFQKEIDKVRSDLRHSNIKEKEAESLRNEAERNKERLARKERIFKRDGKMLMSRSPPSKVKDTREKVEEDQNLVDIQKYLGETHADQLFVLLQGKENHSKNSQQLK